MFNSGVFAFVAVAMCGVTMNERHRINAAPAITFARVVDPSTLGGAKRGLLRVVSNLLPGEPFADFGHRQV
jgi:hypothetical protein